MDTKDNLHAHAACCEGEHAHHHHHDHGHEHHHDHSHDHGHADDEEPTAWWRPALSAALLVTGLVADHWSAFDLLGEGVGPVVRLLWYVVAFLPVGLGVMREAWEEARTNGDWFSEFMLMSVAAVGAFVIGEYPEAVAVMLLYCVGEALQDRAADRARHNVTALLAFRPDRARRIIPSVYGKKENAYEEVAPEAIDVGEEIEVRAGERVPLDGRLLSDDASFDTAALTGESLPRLITKGNEVMAGMIASDRTVRLRVTRPAAESAVSRLLRMVEEASERKAPTELFIRRFAHVYTPTVIALAALAVIVPWVVSLCADGFTFVVTEWVRRALVFLVISCPCALVVSIPLGYFGGIGAASRRGILFKGGHSLDAVAELQAVAFDKTGTLTTGEFRVTDTGGLTVQALATVAAMEGESSHPIARAIRDYCREQGIEPNLSLDKAAVCHEAGYGLSGEAWLVGTLRLLDRHGVAYPDALREEAGTLVAVAHEGRYLGRILLGDTLRADAREAIAALRGLHTDILSGDKQALVDKVAAALGVSHGTGDLLPAQKVERIAALQSEGQKVAFVGDGINDAPVLALADVGFAMGGLGSDMAVETADVVIQTDQPSKVAEAVAIGRRTRRVVWQNIIMSIGVKVAVMALGLAGMASLWMAVFADSGVALLAVLNATRVLIPAGQARNA